MRAVLFVAFCVRLAAQGLPGDKEAALGRQIVEAVRRSTTPVESREDQDYVSQLGAKLGSGFSFEVVATDESSSLHDPVVTPGRHVFVPVSLLLSANDEAELAGMLAQAVGREPILFQTQGGIAPILWSDSFFADNLLPEQARQQRRIASLRADRSAAVALSRVGFDPAALLRYIERLQPSDQERIAALREAVQGTFRGDWSVSDRFSAIQAQVRPAPASPGRLRRCSNRETWFTTEKNGRRQDCGRYRSG